MMALIELIVVVAIAIAQRRWRREMLGRFRGGLGFFYAIEIKQNPLSLTYPSTHVSMRRAQKFNTV
jgi:hypothetical protein